MGMDNLFGKKEKKILVFYQKEKKWLWFFFWKNYKFLSILEKWKTKWIQKIFKGKDSILMFKKILKIKQKKETKIFENYEI